MSETNATMRRCCSRLELAAGLVGAVTGLIAAGPLLWLAAEAHRVGDLGISSAARFAPWELLVLWAGGAVVGGCGAAWLTRLLTGLQNAHTPHWLQHLLHLFAGAAIIIILAPAPLAAVLAVVAQPARAFWDFYLIGGALVGWQSGVIAFVFLYTFHMLDQVRQHKEQSS